MARCGDELWLGKNSWREIPIVVSSQINSGEKPPFWLDYRPTHLHFDAWICLLHAGLMVFPCCIFAQTKTNRIRASKYMQIQIEDVQGSYDISWYQTLDPLCSYCHNATFNCYSCRHPQWHQGAVLRATRSRWIFRRSASAHNKSACRPCHRSSSFYHHKIGGVNMYKPCPNWWFMALSYPRWMSQQTKPPWLGISGISQPRFIHRAKLIHDQNAGTNWPTISKSKSWPWP